ncbi:Uncharacterized protein APZ42_025933 [Daphnia magna]|uniref:C2H2-type domain-containing protein n=1 Tax=Daphnia magna TaxID=35525 RepID=A0A164SMA0_9CRUS|nr:Uncharacterized protein APZ42_025933 [Daphnia magna]
MFNCPSCKKSVQVNSIKDIKVHLSHHKLYGELDFPIRCCEPYCQTTADNIFNFGRHFERFHSYNFQTNECDVVMHDLDIGLENGADPIYLKNLMKEPEVENGIVSYIQIFYDGLGLTNPLKAGATINNSGMFYFTNLSLSPRYNSTLANIHLLATCHTNDIKNKDALNQLLNKIVSELKDLGKNGITIETNDGEKMTLYVKLGQFTADNLGMNQIFGLVESFSGDYCCILCYATREDMQTYETEEEFELRCPREDEIDISMLENLPPGRTHFRGVKSVCALNYLEYCHVMLNCINDSMHSVLEGFCPVVSGNVLDLISEIEDKVTVGNINLEFAKLFGSLIVGKPYKRQCTSLSLLIERKTSRDFVSLPKKASDIPTDEVSTTENFSQYDFVMDNITIGESVVINGTTYKRNSVLVMGWGKYGLVFGKILCVFFEKERDPIFLVQLFDTVEFHSPSHSYFVMPRAPAISRLCTIKDICDYHPLDIYTRNEKHFIRLHNHILCGASLKFQQQIEKGNNASVLELSYLIWTSDNWLMRNCEMRKNFPSSDEILKMAKSIVFYFPSAGSFNSETPWDMLYDPYTRKGSLESYMRGKRFRKQLSDKRTKRQCTTVMFPECDSYTAEEQMEAEESMRLMPKLDSDDTRNHNRNEMLRLMKINYQSRRDFLKNSSHAGAMVFLNKYPHKRRILSTQERTYGNLPVKLAKGVESINRVCQAEIDKKFCHFGNLKERGESCRTVRLMWLNKRNAPFRCYFTLQPTHSRTKKKRVDSGCMARPFPVLPRSITSGRRSNSCTHHGVTWCFRYQWGIFHQD